MDELYLDNIDEYVNDHNKIVSAFLFRGISFCAMRFSGWTRAWISSGFDMIGCWTPLKKTAVLTLSGFHDNLCVSRGIFINFGDVQGSSC